MSQYTIVQKEEVWYDSTTDWKQSQMITAGIDIGSASSQAVIVADGEMVAYSNLQTGASNFDIAQKAIDAVLNSTSMTFQDIKHIIGTGCGGFNALTNKTVSDLTCHARGVHHSTDASVRTVIVMGGQDCMVFHCNENGKVNDFLMNACHPAACHENLCNGCGAAQGSALTVVADTLELPIDKIGEMSLDIDEEALALKMSRHFDERGIAPDKILDEIKQETILQGGVAPLGGALGVVCSSLAIKQVKGLLRNGWPKSHILAIYSAAMAHQAANLIKRLGIKPELAITGGVANNIGVVRRLEKEFCVKAIIPRINPQLTGALGAALIAADEPNNPPKITKKKGIPA